MAKKRQMPDLVFIGPPNQRAAFKYVVFKVEERQDGLPRKLTLILDDETVHIEEGMEFMTGYIPKHMLEELR